MQQGQTFKVLNSDGILHNVHALPKVNGQFNMAMPPSRKEAEHVFDKAEDPFPIKCDVHPWMTAYAVVTDNPFFYGTELANEMDERRTRRMESSRSRICRPARTRSKPGTRSSARRPRR